LTQVNTIYSESWIRSATTNFLSFHGGNGYRLLNQAKEKFSTGPRCPSVKSKRIFVQIVVQVGCTWSPLMCSLQPPLQQRSHPIHQRQQVLPDVSGLTGNEVLVALGGQSSITTPAISANYTTRLHTLLYSRYQTRRRRIRYPSKADTPNVVVFIFNCNKNQRLTSCAATSFPRPFASNKSFVYLHSTRQTITARAYHGSAKLMKPYPYRFVSLEPQNSLESYGTNTVFLADYVPHCPEPQLQRFPRILKYSSCSHRGFVSTAHAVEQFSFGQPSLMMVATRTSKTIGPSQFEYILPAGLLGGKPLLKFH